MPGKHAVVPEKADMGEARQIASSGANQLLHTKLMPPRLHSALVPRPDIFAHLDDVLSKKLALISAPTGFGKTTVASMWMAGRKLPFAWVTLDETDNDPVRFWTYIITAGRMFDAALGKTALSALMGPQPPSLQNIITLFINDFSHLAGPHLLVLDDYHTIASNEIHAAVSFLLQHLPASLHLILITRSEPDLPLGVLRARNELVEIDASNLRFIQPETEAFLGEALSIELPPDTIGRLQERTEGWAAGLRLAALSLQKKRSPAEIEEFIQDFSGSHRYVADYLIKEVFENQPEGIQSFLLKTCFLDRLTGSLCDAVTSAAEGALLLEQLDRDHLFIAQLEEGRGRTWYRYNPLFAEAIQHLARQRLGEAEVQSIFEKASGWYEYHGLLDKAIETALAVKLFRRALTLIERFIEIHDIAELHTLNRWLESIPMQEITLHPVVCFAYAQVILYTYDRYAPATAARLEPLLQAAEATWRAEEDHQRIGQLLSFRGIVTMWQGDLRKAFEFARQSLEEIPEYDVLWRGNSLLMAGQEALSAGRILEAQDKTLEARALLGAAQNIYGVLAAMQMLGETFYWQGELEQAKQLNQQILIDAVGDESMLDDQGVASLNLARIAYEQDELDPARQFAERALDLGRQRGNELLQVQAAIQLAWLYAGRLDLPQARELVNSLAARIQSPSLQREIQWAQAALSVQANELAALGGWSALMAGEKQNTTDQQKEREAFTLARLHIAEGKAPEAFEVLDGWETNALENGRLRSHVEALCLGALAHYSSAALPEAIRLLTQALTIGQAKGFRRIFLDEGTGMAALLQAILPTLADRTLKLYVTTLLHSFKPGLVALHGAPALIEPLSQQELRVLRLLVAGLSNADIARELVVSANTIKTQVKSIYRKLNINSRDEARNAARELKLLN